MGELESTIEYPFDEVLVVVIDLGGRMLPSFHQRTLPHHVIIVSFVIVVVVTTEVGVVAINFAVFDSSSSSPSKSTWLSDDLSLFLLSASPSKTLWSRRRRLCMRPRRRTALVVLF